MEILDRNGWHPIYIHLHSTVWSSLMSHFLVETTKPCWGREAMDRPPHRQRCHRYPRSKFFLVGTRWKWPRQSPFWEIIHDVLLVKNTGAGLVHFTNYHHSGNLLLPSTNQRKRTSYRKHHSFLIGSSPFLFQVPWCPSCHVLSKMLRIHLRHVFLKRWPIWLDQCPCSCDFKNAWNHRLIDWNRFNWTSYFSRNRFHCIDWEVPDGNCCFGVYLSLCTFWASKASSSVSEIFSPWYLKLRNKNQAQ